MYGNSHAILFHWKPSDVVNPERYFPRPGLGSAKELHGQTLQIRGIQHLFCSACLVLEELKEVQT